MSLGIVGSLLANILRFVLTGLARLIAELVMAAVDLAITTVMIAYLGLCYPRKYPLYAGGALAFGIAIGAIAWAAAIILTFDPLDSSARKLIVFGGFAGFWLFMLLGVLMVAIQRRRIQKGEGQQY